MNPFKIVEEFEQALAKYTNAPYAVSCDSCTNGLFMSLYYLDYKDREIVIPTKTYISVAASMIRAGHEPVFDLTEQANNWNGYYKLGETSIYDSAKQLTPNMYIPATIMVLSHHQKKPLPTLGKGGTVLTDSKDFADWLKKARYEGRDGVPYDQEDVDMIGWNHYMTPQQAADGLMKFQNFPKNGIIQQKEDYKPLHKMKFFVGSKTIND